MMSKESSTRLLGSSSNKRSLRNVTDLVFLSNLVTASEQPIKNNGLSASVMMKISELSS